eukprot:1140789-Pelagomonas_calceolata.AAC.3
MPGGRHSRQKVCLGCGASAEKMLKCSKCLQVGPHRVGWDSKKHACRPHLESLGLRSRILLNRTNRALIFLPRLGPCSLAAAALQVT